MTDGTPAPAEPASQGIPPAVLKAARLALWCVVGFCGLVAAYALFRAGRLPGALLARYLGLALGGAAAVIAVLRRASPEWQANAALLLLSLGAAVYIGEIGIAVAGVHRPPDLLADRIRQAKKLGVKFDERPESEVVAALRAEGEETLPNLTPQVWLTQDGFPAGDGRIFPVGGVSGKRFVLCNEAGEYVVIRNDGRGFNNPVQVPSPRVAVVGDSFAQGYCVPAGKDVAGVLRSRGVSAVSRGVNGAGPLVALAILREYVAPERPPVVLWFHYEANDLSDLADEREAPSLMRYLAPDHSQRLAERQAEVDRVLTAFAAEREEELRRRERTDSARQSMAMRILRLWHLRRLRELGKGDTPELPPLFGEILARAKAEVEGWGGALHFVYLPSFYRYAQERDDGFMQRPGVLAAAKEAGLPVHDFHEVLGARGDVLELFPLQMHGHYTEEGFAALAGFLHDRLGDALSGGSAAAAGEAP